MTGRTSKLSSDEALARVREVCFGFPAVEEKLSHGAPWFHVRGKMFLAFSSDHHGDRETAAWCKVEPARQQELVREAPERFFVPPYVGVKGWVGVRLDHPEMDWDELIILVEEGWTSVAPKSAHAAPVRPPPVTAARPKTDPAVSAAAFERVSALCEGLGEVACERETWSATFRVRQKPFAYFLDNHHGDGIVGIWVRAEPGENATLAAAKPAVYFVPPYLGPRGWVGIRLDTKKVDWKEVAARLTASFASVAPKPRARAAKPKPSTRG